MRHTFMTTPALIAFASMFLSATASLGQDAPMALPLDPVPLVVETDAGKRVFQIEIADDPAERAAGLMFRDDLPDDRGMLFVFEETKPVSFWMKNTPLPLDLIFIDQNGLIRDVLPGKPFSEAAISPAEPVRFVLELKRGTAARSGIEDGDLLRHPAIGQASRAGNAG